MVGHDEDKRLDTTRTSGWTRRGQVVGHDEDKWFDTTRTSGLTRRGQVV